MNSALRVTDYRVPDSSGAGMIYTPAVLHGCGLTFTLGKVIAWGDGNAQRRSFLGSFVKYFVLVLAAAVFPASLLGSVYACDMHRMLMTSVAEEVPASASEPNVPSTPGEIADAPAMCCGTSACRCENRELDDPLSETPDVHSCCSQKQPSPSSDTATPGALTPRTLERSATLLQTSATLWPGTSSPGQLRTHQWSQPVYCPSSLLLLHCTSLT